MLQKCPRCELNYITEGEKYCKICRMEMKGESPAIEPELCSVCGERPCMAGKDICLYCYKEMADSAKNAEDDQEEMTVGEEPNIGIDPISGMDEIIPDNDADDSELSLEAMEEEEEDSEEDQDNEDEVYIKNKKER